MSIQKEGLYSLNKRLLSWIGQWPEQSPLAKFLLSINLIFAVAGQMTLQVLGLIDAWTDWDLVIDCSSPLLINIVCLTKYFNCILNSGKMKILLERMKDTWNSILTEEQIEILQAYTREGHKLTWIYTSWLGLCTVGYATLPQVPYLITYFSDNNQTRPLGLLYYVETVVDVEKYYYIILIHSYYATVYLIVIPIAADSMFYIYVQHCCAMFSMAGHQLANVPDGNNLDINFNLSQSEDEVYQKITDTIVKHKDALEFAELLDSAYSTTYLFQTGLNIATMTFCGVEAVININNPEQMVRYGSTALAVSVQFLFLSVPGQRLYDHSLDIRDSIYCCNWYATSLRSRQLLNVMLMRSRVPSEITAGKIFTMSLENFSSVMQAAMSYFTVMTSMR